MFENENALSVSIVEMNMYVQEPLLKRTENPLLWWKDRKSTYPSLFDIMRRLCVTITSVPCERILSKAGMVLSEKRSTHVLWDLLTHTFHNSLCNFKYR